MRAAASAIPGTGLDWILFCIGVIALTGIWLGALAVYHRLEERAAGREDGQQQGPRHAALPRRPVPAHAARTPLDTTTLLRTVPPEPKGRDLLAHVPETTDAQWDAMLAGHRQRPRAPRTDIATLARVRDRLAAQPVAPLPVAGRLPVLPVPVAPPGAAPVPVWAPPAPATLAELVQSAPPAPVEPPTLTGERDISETAEAAFAPVLELEDVGGYIADLFRSAEHNVAGLIAAELGGSDEDGEGSE
jgi:hypothetical protein